MKLYDSKGAELRDFEPLVAGRVGIYVCGPTVQSSPHIGHLRSALAYDLLVRWLAHLGHEVTLVRNVTDIDDKVLAKALELRADWWALAYANEVKFTADYDRLGILRPSYEPRATGHIPQMQALIASLIERGHAYVAGDGSGDVYFDTASWPKYGELTNQKIEDMESENSEGATARAKRNPTDFALWKGRKDGEPASASWAFQAAAPGRPGWHIECSAMATHYLGESFDIHGGGMDLRFPHHENELAQSAAAGHGFATFWLHNGLVQVNGQKISKSLGNTVSSDELFKLAPAAAVRYYLSSAQYRSTLDYQPSVLEEAATALERIYEFLRRCDRQLSKSRFAVAEPAALPGDFTDSMNDDLNVPGALGVLHERVRAGNQALDEERLADAQKARGEVGSMLAVLGLSREQWLPQASPTDLALDRVIAGLIEERNQARDEKDFAKADSIRDQLTRAGVSLSDDADGTHWSIN